MLSCSQERQNLQVTLILLPSLLNADERSEILSENTARVLKYFFMKFPMESPLPTNTTRILLFSRK